MRWSVPTWLTMCVVSLHLTHGQSPPLISAQRSYSIPENTKGVFGVLNVIAFEGDLTVQPEFNFDKYASLSVIYQNKSFYEANMTLKKELDYESLSNLEKPIQMVVGASDGQKSSSSEIWLYITDVNDIAPIFTHQPYTHRTPENLEVGSVVYHVNATDPEPGRGGQVSYSLATYSDKFSIDEDNGTIYLTSSLDYETLPFYLIKVNASDGYGLSSQADVYLTLEDVQDQPPYFTQLPYIKTIPENLANGSSIFQVFAEDGDRGNPDAITFSLKNSTCAGLMDVTASGDIILISKPDRDEGIVSINNGACILTVNASEVIVVERPQHGNSTALETVTIYIEDQNDNIPVFSSSIYNATIKENMPVGVPLNFVGGQLTVSDKDQGENAKFTLNLRNYTDDFEVVPDTVQGSASILVKVKNSSLLDYEVIEEIVLQIQACQDGFCNSSAEIVLSIENENDLSPKFEKPTYIGSVIENSVVLTSVINITAKDDDKPPYNNFSYAVIGGGGIFAISSTGEVYVTSSSTDRESRPVYYLTVEATDSGGRRDTTQLTVNITDANDNAPAFNQQYTGFLTENSKSFQRPITIHATDADEGLNAEVTYAITSTIPSGFGQHFHVDNITGVLSVKSPVDLEPQCVTDIVVVVSASDSGSPSNITPGNVTLSIQDQNDRTPNFTSSYYGVSTDEDSILGTSVLTVSATDEDCSEQFSTVFYTLSGDGSERFVINATSGEVSVGLSLDREQKAEYTLTATAMDRGNPPRTATSTINITINDVNDELPKFQRQSMFLSLNETEGSHIVLYVVNASDPDEDSDLHYTVLWSASQAVDENSNTLNISDIQGIIKLDASSGELILNGSVDREKVERFTLTLSVQDLNAQKPTSQTATATLSVTVLDINDNKPKFTKSEYSAEIPENSQPGMPISLPASQLMTVSDSDKGANARFTLSLDSYEDSFELVPTNVQGSSSLLIKVTNSTILDYEQRQHLTLVIQACQASNCENAAIVNLNITNENDETPMFTNSSYVSDVTEGSPANTSIINVVATDADMPPYDQVTYSLLNADGKFDISSSGEVYVTSSSTDRESRPVYYLTVEATDSGGWRDTAQLTVNITDANDNAPAFNQQYTGFITENSKSFQRPITIHASDADIGENGMVSYSLTNSIPGGYWDYFSVDNTTGMVSVDTKLDYEVLNSPSLVLIVTATDSGHPPLSSHANITLTVQDLNDNPPKFNKSDYTGNISEAAGPNTRVLQVWATDRDGTDQNSAVFYMLEGDGSDKFRIDGATGVISVAGGLDRESVAHYNLTATVMDRGTPPLNDTSTVYITIDNVNDVPPTFQSQTMSLEVPEMNATDEIIFNVTADDEDDDADLRYSIIWADSTAADESSADVNISHIQSIMRLEPMSGHLVLDGVLDRERVERITLTVQVVDDNAQTLPQTATATLRITVLDVDDNRPEFNNTHYAAVIRENSQPGSPIMFQSAISVSDADQGENAMFELSLLNLDDVFEVFPASVLSSGVVSIRVKNNKRLDYENITMRNITLHVRARGGPPKNLTTVVDVAITVTDANDNSPNFTKDSYNVTIPENSMAGAHVVTAMATDKDSAEFGIDFYRIPGALSNFQVNSTTGEISVSNGSDLDRESQSIYRLTVEAVDKGGRMTSVPITVHLSDVNDNSPDFGGVEYIGNLREGDAYFSRPIVIKATDRDEKGTNNSYITYSIKSSSADLAANFSVDIDGNLTLDSPVDYESLPNAPAVQLVVVATDHGESPRSASTNVNIQVQDINDNSPTFNSTMYIGHVKEDSTSNTRVLQVWATDRDGTDQNSAVFYMLEGDGSDKFRIDGATGVISVAGGLDRESVAQYKLTATVMDRGTPPLNCTSDVYISVLNVNDVVPRFQSEVITVQKNETVQRNESSSPGVFVTVAASDGDEDSQLLYTVFWNESSALDENLQSVNISRIEDILQLNNKTGTIMLIGDLDREEVETIELKLHVVDENAEAHRPQTATAVLKISVLDVDDNRPTFDDTSYVAEIDENSQSGIPIKFTSPPAMTVSDIDKDLNSMFSLALLDYDDVFEVVPNNARSTATVIIRVKNSTYLDYEMRTSINMTLIANETRVEPSLSSTVSISLSINDVNDHPPQFTANTYNTSIPENSTSGTFVLNVMARDNDSSLFDMDYYRLLGSQSNFEINNTTGEVTVAAEGDLDREKQDTYRLTVEAVDKGDRRSSVPVTVHLTDVNDNPPLFTRVEYITSLTENEPQFASPLIIKTTDDDEDGTKNVEVSYSIVSLTSALSSNFSIYENGSLTPDGPIDYELLSKSSRPNIQLIVIATDGGSPTLTSNVTVSIQVQDTNDMVPYFLNDSYFGSVDENTEPNTDVLTVSARDEDGTPQNSVVFYMLEGAGSDKFQINGATGDISKVGELDSETVAQYNLTATVMDRGNPPLNSTVDVTITVLNVNDEKPRFSSNEVSVQIDETNAIGSELYRMTAIDGDADSNLIYSIFWNESSASDENLNSVPISRIQEIINLNTSNGGLVLNDTLDREEVDLIILKLHVLDLNAVDRKPQTDTATLKITVLDVDDNSPLFNDASYSAQIDENSPPGIPISLLNSSAMTVTDIDKDINSVFSLELLDDDDVFEVVPSVTQSAATVIIRVKNSTLLDYETRESINFTIIASETLVTKPRSTTASIMVHIRDANDNSPFFLQHYSNYTADIPENSTDGTSVLTVQAVDDDSDEFNLDYYLIQGSQTTFEINDTTGEVTVASDGDLDREKQDTYRLTVEAVDKGGRRSSVPVTVHLTDVNDNPPLFTRVEYITSLTENEPQFVRPVTIEATDKDERGTKNSMVYYSLDCTSELKDNFTIGNISGLINLTTPIDYEQLVTQPNIELCVIASDAGSPAMSSQTNVTITVQDINDNAPYFLNEPYLVTVPENSKPGTFVMGVLGQDEDGEAPNNQFLFVIDSGGSDHFRIDGRSGNISVQSGARLDRETTDAYSLVILVIDQGTPALTSTATVAVNISDVNDTPPRFNQSVYEVTVNENQTEAIMIYQMISVDPDENPHLNYSIVWGESLAFDEVDNYVNITEVEGWFRIDGVTGHVYAEANVTDREIAERVNLRIQANDDNADVNTPQTATASLTVTLSDINDNVPRILQGTNISIDVAEGTRQGTEILTLEASDKDKRQTVVFTTQPNSTFSVTEQGRLTLSEELDRETESFLSFTVLATDSGVPPLTSTATIHVTTIDINDNDPNITTTQSVFPVQEGDEGNGTVVATFEATDKDEGPNANVTFFFSDYFGSKFQLNHTSGELLLVQPLDREEKSSYSLTIVARDNPIFGSPRRVLKTITINVTDIDDNSPKFQGNYQKQISELTKNGSDVIRVQATDADIGINAEIWYTMTSSFNLTEELFAIDPHSGLISAIRNLRDLADTYTMTVVATDQGDEKLTGQTNVTIKVLDENLHSPIFTQVTSIEPVPECADADKVIHRFYATDRDRDKENNGKVMFKMDDKTPKDTRDTFRLSSSGELTTHERLDSEVKDAYKLTVQAYDLGIPPRNTSSIEYTIRIKDNNDHPPMFNVSTNNNEEFSVDENQIGVELGPIQAMDPDKDSRICYSLSSDDSDTPYMSHLQVVTHDNKSMYINVTQPFDRENVTSIKVTVTASDCSPEFYSKLCSTNDTRKTSDEMGLMLHIKDENDNPPTFTSPLFTAGIRNNAKVGRVIFDLKNGVSDRDTAVNSQHRFFLLPPVHVDSQLQQTFDVTAPPVSVSEDGVIVTDIKFSGDNVGYLSLDVTANDTAGMANATVRVYIIADFQVLRITFKRKPEDLRQLQTKFIRDLSKQTGLTFVVNDDITTPTDANGEKMQSRSELSIHAVNPETGEILNAKEAREAVDTNSKLIETLLLYGVLHVGEADAEVASPDSSQLHLYVVVAIAVLLLITLCIIVAISCDRVKRYRRKLRAATIEIKVSAPVHSDNGVVNVNPLFNKDIALSQERDRDRDSLSSSDSLDENVVHGMKKHVDDEQEITVNFFDEEKQIRYGDKFLGDALRHYDFIDEELGHRGYDVTDTGSSGSDERDPKTMMNLDINASYDDMESTEI